MTGVSVEAESREIEAFLRLKARPGLGERRIRKLVEATGSGSGALARAGEQGDLLEDDRVPVPLPEWRKEGIDVVPMTAERYPSALGELTDPPPVLFLKGRQDLVSRPAVAIVGSRRATRVGRRTAEVLARTLAEGGVTVVSGMALGIDGAAHRGALEGGGDTVAVLGSGFHVVYPASHRPLFREIGRRGLLVSEFLPDQGAMPHHFPKRNRIIAALVRAVVVVEAGARSGALITVDHGLDLGREVFAVPGTLENPQARGSNGLLREGARLVTDPGTLLDDLRELGLEVGEAAGDRGAGGDPEFRLPPELAPVWAALGPDPRTVDDLARKAGLPATELLAALSTLELEGRVTRCPGARFQRVSGRFPGQPPSG